MTTLPDLEPAALEAARKAWDIEDNLNDALEDAIRAYLAARSTVPEAGKAVVKALEWVGPHMSMWVSEPLPGFQYRIIHDGRGHNAFSWFVGGVWTPVASLEAAQAAAQADYEARILSALASAPAPSGAAEPLAWAVERWNAEVKNRPLQNVHRRSLDTTWRQVIRQFGGDAEALCGPSHESSVDQKPLSPPTSLLQALKACVESMSSDHPGSDAYWRAVDMAEAAIASAEGI